MFKPILLLFGLVATILPFSTSQVICGEGQEPRQCGCDLSCFTLDAACRGVCTDYDRCFCKDGYVRETNGPDSRCIPREKCPSVSSCPYCDPEQAAHCEQEKIWVKCTATTEPRCCGCDTQCKDPNCESECFDSPRCLCKEGYVQDPSGNGQCIPVEKCGVACGKWEVTFMFCLSTDQ